MDDKESRHGLLEYTRSLRQRREDQSVKQGFSIWGLYVAIVYLIWALVPQASTVLSEIDNKTIIAAIFTHTHLALLAFCAYLTGVSSSKPKTIFDYRIEAEDSPFEYSHLILITFVFFFLPAYTSYVSLYSGLELGEFQKIQLWFNLIIAGICALTFLVGLPFEHYYRKKTRLPLINLLASNQSNKKYVTFTHLMVILLLIGNSIVLFDYVSVRPVELLMTFNLSLLLIAITVLTSLQMQRETLYELNNLERDIILHDIDNREIINRLERSFLGHHLGNWIESLVKNVNEKSFELIELAKEIDEFIESINRINPEYSIERATRLNSFMMKLSSKFQEFDDEITPLLNWFIQADKQSKNLAPEIVTILNKNREQLSYCAKKNTDLFRDSMDKLGVLYTPTLSNPTNS